MSPSRDFQDRRHGRHRSSWPGAGPPGEAVGVPHDTLLMYLVQQMLCELFSIIDFSARLRRCRPAGALVQQDDQCLQRKPLLMSPGAKP